MKKFFRWFRYFFNAFLVICIINPLYEKNLLCSVYLPGLNEIFYEFNTPLFWLFYSVQVCLLYFAVIGLSFYVCLALTFIFFGTTMLQILKYKIKSLKVFEKPAQKVQEPKMVEMITIKDINEEIVTCIKMHLDIKGFVSICM